jgi:hypothetical protein
MLKRLLNKHLVGLEVGTFIYTTVLLGCAVYFLNAMGAIDWYVNLG